MKKTLSMILAITLCLSLSLIFTACGHEHSFATDWSKDATHHWHACTGEDCTDVADKAEHTFDAGTVTTAATNTTAGTKTFTCSVCAATKTEPYSAVTTIADDAAWAAAFDLGTNWSIHAVASSGGVTAMDILAQRNGNKFTKGEGNDHDAYDAVEGNNCYTYRATYNNNEFVGYTQADMTSQYASVDVFIAQWSQTYIPSILFGTRTDFTYNEQTKNYEAASLMDGAATNVWISFADGKIVAVGYDMAMSPTAVATCVITVTYGNVGEITLPTNIVTNP